MAKETKKAAAKKTQRTREKRGAGARQGQLPPPLLGKRKPEEFRQYGLFMALPIEERKEIFAFTTDKQFAAHFKVDPATLSRWKWEEELWEIRDEYLIVFKKHTAEIIGALAKRAKRSGEAFHTLSFLKIVEGFTEKSGLDITSKGKKVSGFEVVIRHAQNSPTSSRDKDAGKN